VVPGFNSKELKANHRLAFKDAINTLVHSVIWLAIFPVWLLAKSPLQIHKKLVQALCECSDYFKELSEYKIQQIERDEKAADGTMDLMGPLVKASENTEDSKDPYLTKQEVIANAWILLFAGHETSGSITHYSILWLAIELSIQAQLQADIDDTVGERPWSTWTYENDLGRLYQSMIGAVINETLRLLPPIIDIPKIVRETPQSITWDGKTVSVPPTTIIHLSAVAVHRNPRYWPHSPSKVSAKKHDLDDWVPERWFASSVSPEVSDDDGKTDPSSFETAPRKLLVPPKGAYVPFSEGRVRVPGNEITAVLAVLFKTHSVELDVSTWASDEEVEAMSTRERRA
ncbi:Cytochrome P450 3A9, partial [Lachnellula suecica]